MRTAELSLDPRHADQEGFITDAKEVETLLVQISMLDENIFQSNPWGRESYRDSAVQDYDQLTVLLEDGGDVLAYGLLRMFDDAEVIRIAVRPESRRNGYGRQILDLMLSAVRKRKIENIFLEVRDGNEAARKLYENAGFETEGIRKRYYSNPIEDAVIMRYTC